MIGTDPATDPVLGRFAGRVLDVGSGGGSTVDPASSVPVAGLTRVGSILADRSFPAGAAGCRVRVELDGPGLPFASASFDAAACNHVLEHVERPANLLLEIARVLRPSGILVAAVPNGYSFSDTLYRGWQTVFRATKGEPIAHVQRFSRAAFLHALENAGFRVVRVSDMGETYDWLWKHGRVRSVLRKLTDSLRRLTNDTFIYGWHAIASRR